MILFFTSRLELERLSRATAFHTSPSPALSPVSVCLPPLGQAWGDQLMFSIICEQSTLLFSGGKSPLGWGQDEQRASLSPGGSFPQRRPSGRPLSALPLAEGASLAGAAFPAPARSLVLPGLAPSRCRRPGPCRPGPRAPLASRLRAARARRLGSQPGSPTRVTPGGGTQPSAPEPGPGLKTGPAAGAPRLSRTKAGQGVRPQLAAPRGSLPAPHLCTAGDLEPAGSKQIPHGLIVSWS